MKIIFVSVLAGIAGGAELLTGHFGYRVAHSALLIIFGIMVGRRK